jgi:hypothetical protein
MKSFRLAIVIAVAISCLCRVSAAQNVYGTTTIDIDPSSGIVTATCETDLDGALDGNYYSNVLCNVTDQNGTQIASGSAGDVDGDLGYAQVVLTFSGTPGSTYTATGFHRAIAVLVVEQFEKTLYEDPYNFSSFESDGIQDYPNYYDWYGPGPDEQTKIASIRLGETWATATDPQIPTSLKVLSVTVLPTGTTNNSGCAPTADYGIQVDIKYQVLDQAGQPILQSGMTPYEAVQFATGGSKSGNIGPTQNSNSSLTTASDGTFHDVPLGACTTGVFSNANELQVIYINFPTYKVRQNSFIINSTGAGHGSITNSTDVTASR